MISPLRNPGRRIFLSALALLLATLLCLQFCARRPASTVATFNIELFPKSERQVAGAFETIRELSAGAVALQEITEPRRFRRAVDRRLEGDWRVVFADTHAEMRVGLLYDAGRYRLVGDRTHDDTAVYEGGRPVLEVELDDRRGGALELFVVHLRAGSDGLPTRRIQHRRLRDVVDDHASTTRRTVVLGDFNSTEPEDRELLQTTAGRADLRWVSRRIDCTGYWIPEDRCRAFTLDHVLAEGLAGRSISRGPCASVGCSPGATCPTFHRRVSDHCPVVTTVPGAR